MKNLKRTAHDAAAPIVKTCSVDVYAVWNKQKKISVSQDLTERVEKILSAVKTY